MAHHAGDEEPLSPHIRNEVSILGEASESEVSTFANQVAGHGTMLTSRDGLLKPVEGDEFVFYEDINGAVESEVPEPERSAVLALRNGFMPKYFGEWTLTENLTHSHKGRFVCLEDLTRDCKRACIMDAKLGTRQHTTLMSAEKIHHAREKCALSTSLRHGVRLCGVRCEGPLGNLNLNKNQMKTFDMYETKNTISHFLQQRMDIAAFFLSQLKKLEELMAVQKRGRRGFQMVLWACEDFAPLHVDHTSLLFVYDADSSTGVASARMKIIDFAHSFRMTEDQIRKIPPADEDEALDGGPHERDEGFLLGLQTLISVFDEINANSA